ncbi:hypothetical protein MES5069_1270010 [Mesorhizobium escarrei]|uniref:Uncharacterized protein n=1 Tax=Mesorhizobium escarrei TaxID=666018 RepID=A0ABM9DH41_9HYPH|nr:hypothetical protein MES5069_1270010 [Mesorhizobium escarrei]
MSFLQELMGGEGVLRFRSGRAGVEDGRAATKQMAFENRSGADIRALRVQLDAQRTL